MSLTRLGGTRRLATGAVATALVCTVFAFPARSVEEGTGGPASDVVHGQIAVPTPVPVSCAAAQTDVPIVGWVLDQVRPGAIFSLAADEGSWQDDFDITFFATEAACRAGTALPYSNHAGDENSIIPAGASVAVVTLHSGKPGARFTFEHLPKKTFGPRAGAPRRPTVVAIMEPRDTTATNGFSPYHYDFLGADHPWNKDDTKHNDLDFSLDPRTYIPGMPETEPRYLSLPTSEADVASDLAAADADKWTTMKASSKEAVKLYRFPGTKVVAATNFLYNGGPGSVYAPVSAHGTRSASVAAGNRYGACPECVFVLVTFHTVNDAYLALQWVTKQDWIDVVSNSYTTSVAVASLGVFLNGALADTAAAGVEKGQTIVWGAGNGLTGTFGVPGVTYTSGLTGPDWGVVVGGVSVNNDQSLASHRPVDIAAYGHNYPSAGGTTAGGEGFHEGTSNAAPVVAGTFAKVVQMGRDLLGDGTPGHQSGVVAEGKPFRCGPANDRCVLGNGKLTRKDVERLVFQNVLPSPAREVAPPDEVFVGPIFYATTTTPSLYAYTGQGHGIVYGRYDPGRHVAQQRRFLDALGGAVASYSRPPGEANWTMVDSKCRQRLWGTWGEGDYDGRTTINFDPVNDGPAMAMDAWCSSLPPRSFVTPPLTKELCTTAPVRCYPSYPVGS